MNRCGAVRCRRGRGGVDHLRLHGFHLALMRCQAIYLVCCDLGFLGRFPSKPGGDQQQGNRERIGDMSQFHGGIEEQSSECRTWKQAYWMRVSS